MAEVVPTRPWWVIEGWSGMMAALGLILWAVESDGRVVSLGMVY